MKTVLFAVIYATILSIATVAGAAEIRPYAGVFTGFIMPMDSTLTDSSGFTSTAAFDTGFMGGGTVGLSFENGLRLEAEGSYRTLKMNFIKVRGTSDFTTGSTLSATSLLLNLFWDIPMHRIVKPYFGGGIGYSNVNLGGATNQGHAVLSVQRGARLWDGDDDNVLAYQLGAGVGFDVSKNVTIDVGYRFFGTQDVTLNVSRPNSAEFDFTKADFSSHNVTVGMRYWF